MVVAGGGDTMKMDKNGQIKTDFMERGHTNVNFRERTQKCLFSETNQMFIFTEKG